MKKYTLLFTLLMTFLSINSQIVINEINYKDALDFQTKDWIELYNNNTTAVDISNWVFKDSNDLNEFIIPDGTVMPANSYLVFSQFLINFQALFPSVSPVLGDFTFGLAGGGELIRLFNATGDLIDSVTYDDIAPWPIEPDGNGPTLELKNPNLDNTIATNWAPSIAPGTSAHGTPGAQNSTFDVTLGVNELDNIDVSISPNPFTYNAVIKLSNNDLGVHVIIYNILGKEVRNVSSNKTNITINKGDLTEGAYFVKVFNHNGKGIHTQKLVVN